MKVAATKTQWAPPWNHHLIAVNMDGILKSCGVDAEHVRRRMIAHAVMASGWRQNVWCYNAWGVKTGKSWTGDFYTMSTQEDDGTGAMYTIPDDAWRAFPNWAACVVDFQGRISESSSRYAAAHAALVDASRSDQDYWDELGAAGYYTSTTPVDFDSICDRVANEIAAATPAELLAAASIQTGWPSLADAGPAIGLFVGIALVIVLVMALG